MLGSRARFDSISLTGAVELRPRHFRRAFGRDGQYFFLSLTHDLNEAMAAQPAVISCGVELLNPADSYRWRCMIRWLFPTCAVWMIVRNRERLRACLTIIFTLQTHKCACACDSCISCFILILIAYLPALFRILLLFLFHCLRLYESQPFLDSSSFTANFSLSFHVPPTSSGCRRFFGLLLYF